MSRTRGRLSITNVAVTADHDERVRRAAAPGPEAEEPKRWWRIENAKEKDQPAKIYLYDAIGGWFGLPASAFVEELNAIEASQIDLHVNSPGGSVFDGLAIMNALAAHSAEVTAHVDGLAASAASFLIQAADKVVMGRQSQMMIHDAQGICMGNAADMLAEAELLDSVSDAIADVYSEATGTVRAAWRERMKAETWYGAQEAVDAGLADECAPKRQPREGAAQDLAGALSTAAFDLTAFRYAGREQAPAPTGVAATTPVVTPTPPAPAAPVENPAPADLDLSEMFRRGLSDGAGHDDLALDRDDWRSVLQSAAFHAPATPSPRPEPTATAPVVVPPAPPAPAPDYGLRETMQTAAAHAPAVPEPSTAVPTTPERDDPVLTRSDMINALREAIR